MSSGLEQAHPKPSAQHIEQVPEEEERVEVTEEDNRRILRKTDIYVLSILAWVYWLQILDKSVLGYAATFGLKTDAHLLNNQYSTIGSLNAIAQLAWMPFSSYLIVRVPPRILMSVIVSCWGAALCGMAASTSYPGLAACRFLLGLFEAACLPLFAVLTSVWYRRAEQPLRICVWYGTNGLGTIMASAFAYGFGNIKSPKIHVYQMIFLFCGLMTVCTGPFVYWRLSNSISEARFLSAEDRKKAVERVRSNNTGTDPTNKFKWGQALEAALDLKTWLFFAMALCVNFGASVTLTFGPLILKGIGFDKFRTSLLNMPFGAFQIIVIFFASYGAYWFKVKSLIMASLVLPVLGGLIVLYVLPRPNEGGLLAGYYLLAFLYGTNPLIVSWISANTAGSTKKSVVLVGFNAASACGNIIGPLLFRDEDAPLYKHGLLACIGIFSALVASIALQIFNFFVLNRMKRAERVRNGKPADFHDASMDKRFRQHVTPTTTDVDKLAASTMGVVLGDNALLDLTDRENDEFVYVY
ncbi:major facilitator superfamily domain-containing protein [Mycena belliarum]|uniref:Major facilitator superfamily domain-containing protein n=1 Tax=Mycena belliarum TaxID=1033014 RepID=A0AAD6XRI4_9AGAR|nr:major facilitator superfamily domain-containing protein [Mycena belliae]